MPSSTLVSPSPARVRGALAVAIAIAAFLAATPADAADPAGAGELERLVRKDGSTVVGTVIGFADGAYRVQVAGGVIEVPAKEVRTIEPTGERAPARPEPTPVAASWGARLAESLGTRAAAGVGEESRRLFSDAVAALLRGDWDIALRGARAVADREPDWADPLLVMLVVRTESGHETEALRLALRVEAEFPEDALALATAAEVLRRGGFPVRAAELLERTRLRSADPAARRELARTWWPLDRERAAVHWRAVVAADPSLERLAVPEAELLRKARSAIALGDLLLAGQWIEEAASVAPWAEEQVLAARTALAEARLGQAEQAGDLPIATLAADTLVRLGGSADAAEQRLARLRAQELEVALGAGSAEELERWHREHAHLLGGDEGAVRAIAVRLAEFGLEAAGRGELASARRTLELARSLSPGAAPAENDRRIAPLVGRAIDEISQRREEMGVAVLRLVHDFFPAHDAPTVERLGEFLASPRPGLLSEPERRAVAGRLAALYGTAGEPLAAHASPPPAVAPAPAPAAPAGGEDLAAAVAAIARWFPVTVGTRWTYRLSDGLVETREVISSGADGSGGWLVVIRVTQQGRNPYETRAWVRAGTLTLGAPTAPPGEILIRGALAPGDRWEWRRDSFAYRRQVENAEAPVDTPAGTWEETRVVRAENSLESEAGGRTWNAEHRITWAAGVGVVRIEGAGSGIDRELIDFLPGSDVIGSAGR